MVRRFNNLWKKWTGGTGLRDLSVVSYLPVLLFCSLVSFFIFSSDTYAHEYVGAVHNLGSDVPAVDMNEYTVYSGSTNLGSLYYIPTSYSYGAMDNSYLSGVNHGAIYSPNSWSFGVNYDSSQMRMEIPTAITSSWIIPNSAIQSTASTDVVSLSCSSNEYFVGESMSYSNVSFSNPVLYSTYIDSPLGFPYTQASGTLLIDSDRISSSDYTLTYSDYTTSSDSGSTYLTLTTVFKITNSASGTIYWQAFSDPVWYFDEFYATDSDGTNTTTATWEYNGFVVGCSENSVKSMLSSKDPTPTTPESPIPSGFPSTWDSDSNQNNQDAWDTLNNINPESFQVDSGSSSDIIQLLLSFFRSFASIQTGKEYCQIYMPAYFGSRFNFGNNVGGDFLYVNLCDNPFITGLWTETSWLNVLSLQSTYYNQEWLYVGVRGLIWLFCFWLLIKILLGYVYWIYSLIDTTFGLANDIEDL